MPSAWRFPQRLPCKAEGTVERGLVVQAMGLGQKGIRRDRRVWATCSHPNSPPAECTWSWLTQGSRLGGGSARRALPAALHTLVSPSPAPGLGSGALLVLPQEPKPALCVQPPALRNTAFPQFLACGGRLWLYPGVEAPQAGACPQWRCRLWSPGHGVRRPWSE